MRDQNTPVPFPFPFRSFSLSLSLSRRRPRRSSVRNALLGHKISANIRAHAEKPITVGRKINRKQNGKKEERKEVSLIGGRDGGEGGLLEG